MNSNRLKENEVKKYKFKPRVAVNVLVFNKKKEVLLVKRAKNDALDDLWGGIAGKVEYLEKAGSTVVREVKEESNLTVLKPKFLGYTENVSGYPHYIVLWFCCLSESPEEIKIDHIENSESGWFSFEKIPEPIHSATKEMIMRAFNISLERY